MEMYEMKVSYSKHGENRKKDENFVLKKMVKRTAWETQARVGGWRYSKL